MPHCFSEVTSLQTLQTSHVPWTHPLQQPPVGFKDAIVLHPCLHPSPSDHACCLPANLPVTWHSPTVLCDCPLCLPVSGSACQPGSVVVGRATSQASPSGAEAGAGRWGWSPDLLRPGTGSWEALVPKGQLPQARGREASWAGWGRVGECRPGGKATFLLTKPMC